MNAAPGYPGQPERRRLNPSTVRTILFWTAMILLAVLLWKMASVNSPPPRIFVNDAQFQAQMEGKNIRSVHATVFRTRTLLIAERRDSGEKFQAYVSNDQLPKIIQTLEQDGADVWIEGRSEQQNDWVSILLDAVPFLLLLIAFFVIMRRRWMNKTPTPGVGQSQ